MGFITALDLHASFITTPILVQHLGYHQDPQLLRSITALQSIIQGPVTALNLRASSQRSNSVSRGSHDDSRLLRFTHTPRLFSMPRGSLYPSSRALHSTRAHSPAFQGFSSRVAESSPLLDLLRRIRLCFLGSITALIIRASPQRFQSSIFTICHEQGTPHRCLQSSLARAHTFLECHASSNTACQTQEITNSDRKSVV